MTERISLTSDENRKSSNIFLQWNDFTVQREKDKAYLLHNITGEVKGGQSLAIMGSSGAGKTTFLNYLSRKSSTPGLSKVSGDFLFSINQIDEKKEFRSLSGYVTQDDVLYEVLTPRELFSFAAEMRLPKKSDNQRKELVETLIENLGLTKSANTKVGSVLKKGLSGGERKRTAIGYELIVDPVVLFLDEPTTGLDSSSAYKVVSLISREAQRGRILIYTIHQPSSEIFKLFDRLLLLTQGKMAYQGQASDAIDYFEQLKFSCPKNFNPAEFFIKILSKEPLLENESNIEEVKKLDEEYAERIKLFTDKCHEESTDSLTNAGELKPNTGQVLKEKNPFFKELRILLNRNNLLLMREPLAFFVRLAMSLVNAILIIMIFWRMKKDDDAVRNRSGCLFFLTNAIVNANMQTALLAFTKEKEVFYKEQDNSMYRVVTYYLSKTLGEIPIQIITSVLTFAIVYFACNLNTNSVDNYIFFTLDCFLSGYAASSFAYFLSSLIDRKELAPAIFPIFIFTQALTSGFFVNMDNIPYIFYPFKYISVFRYSYQGFAYNEFIDNDLNCNNKIKCRLPTDDFPESLEVSLLILAIIAIFNNIVSCIALKIKSELRRKRN